MVIEINSSYILKYLTDIFEVGIVLTMLSDKDNKFIIYRILRFIGKPVMKIMYRPTITGKENIPEKGRVIIAGNHKHALDPILVDISTDRIVRTLAKKELHDGPFGFMFRSTGTIPVDLHSPKNHSAFESALEVLNNDGVINVSPEAKRNYTDELLLPFKYGAAAMSDRTGAPVVPYSITGEYRLFRKSIRITFGKPFVPDSSGGLYYANKEIYETVLSLLKENTSEEILKNKTITSFDEWEAKNNAKTS